MGCKINNLWVLIVILKTDMQCYPITFFTVQCIFLKKSLTILYTF